MSKLSDVIVKQLFENGAGQKAMRLVLELEDGSYGGGWCPYAINALIESAELITAPDAATRQTLTPGNIMLGTMLATGDLKPPRR